MNNVITVVIAALVSAGIAVGSLSVFQNNNAPELGRAILNSPYFQVGGLTEWRAEADLATGTTTICAIQAPMATSTLVGGGLNLRVSSTTASTVTIAKATTAFATTTIIRQASVSANAQATILAASTTVNALAQTDSIFAPGEWLVFGMAGGTGTFSPAGACSAAFQQLAY